MDPIRRADPFLDWKVRIFFSGAVLLAAGIVFGHRVLVLLAIVVLAVGAIATAILARRHRRAATEAADPEDADEEPHPLA
ncbi:MAG: hypothetical protein KY467_16905 [Gemmatimonadetes bacterium]|nr:hypothetical protein [Gemmatimonadota bacterium]